MRTLLYILFLTLRILAVLQPGYIHPDEFFQGGQELFFGCPNEISQLNNNFMNQPQSIPIITSSTKQIPLENDYGSTSSFYGFDKITATWEFQRENAVRSIVPPSFMTLFPLMMYSKFRQWCSAGSGKPWMLGGWEIFIIPRIFMTLLSIIAVDLPLWFIVRKREACMPNNTIQKGVPIELCVFSSSWTTICFLTRPFSNSLETFCISLLCAVAAIDLEVERSRYQKVLVPLLTGFLCAVGLFVRFTFVIFALPIVLATLSRRFATAGASSHSKMKSVLSCIIWIAIPFLVASSFFVYHDFKFYSLQSSHSVETDASITTTQLENFWKYVAPWNAFRYNAKMENLADHGLHPRITHVLVNFPMLFGLIAISFYVTLSKKLVGDKHSKQSPLDRMLHGVILFGLGILSCAPHQEPRFLLPLIIPLILLHGRDLVELGRYGNVFLVLWIGFNVILMAFFGLMHQGAVVSSVMSLPDILRQAPLPQGVVIYYNTYMPPTFLLRRHPSNHLITPPYNHENARDTCPDFFVFDAQSSTKTKLLELISKSSSCCGNKYHSSVHLIAPKGLCDELSDEFRCRELWSLFQISTENLPTVKAIQNLLEYSRLSVNVIEWVPPVCKSSQIT